MPGPATGGCAKPARCVTLLAAAGKEKVFNRRYSLAARRAGTEAKRRGEGTCFESTAEGCLSLLAALPAALALPPWIGPSAARARQVGERGLVDAHCHLFNVTDLAATRFILVSFLGIYPRPSGPTFAERALERSLRGIIARLSRGVPSAADEADSIGVSLLAPAIVRELSASEAAELDRLKDEAGDAVRAVEKEREGSLDLSPEPPGRCRPVGGSGIASSFKAGMRWVKVLRSYRSGLARSLAARHSEAGYRTRLLCPALSGSVAISLSIRMLGTSSSAATG